MKPSNVASGVRSSWLALATKSARSRSARMTLVTSCSSRSTAGSTVGLWRRQLGAQRQDMGIEAALHRHRNGELDVSAGRPVQHAVDRFEQLRLADDAGQIAPGADIAVTAPRPRHWPGAGASARPPAAGDRADRPARARPGRHEGEALLALAPAADGIDQPRGEAAAERRIPARRRRDRAGRRPCARHNRPGRPDGSDGRAGSSQSQSSRSSPATIAGTSARWATATRPARSRRIGAARRPRAASRRLSGGRGGIDGLSK